MKNALISWVLPTTRKEGGLLAPTEIRDVLIELSANGGVDFAPVGSFTPGTLQAPVNDLPASDLYQVRGTVFDTLDQAGNSVVVPFVIPDDSPPGELTAINVVLS